MKFEELFKSGKSLENKLFNEMARKTSIMGTKLKLCKIVET